ncbi:MAG TPA: allantoicase [Gemmatimonadota bacterium]|nr:allantoicase [Gemmatimonadota bacterium]
MSATERAAFERWPDLADRRVGGTTVAANDEFFAPKDRLVEPGPPEFRPDEYTDRGKWMDGWETRRRRDPGHDWCVVRLGAPGVVHGVVVDTRHFRGNHPEAASVEGARLEIEPLKWEDPAVEWVPLVPRSPLAGDAENGFRVDVDRTWTHVRLSIFPDGGVARLRVHGEARPDWDLLARTGRAGGIELAAIPRGGAVMACSDEFFGAPGNLLLPGDAQGMWDGWETRRRRGPGHDWVVVRLGHRARIERVEIDTRHFKGNYPESARLEAIDAPDAAAGPPADAPWRETLPRTRLLPDDVHPFEAPELTPVEATHVRLSIFPDGGVARLRVFGTPLA